MSTNFSGPPPYDGFCCIFLYYGKLMGKPLHFPYDEVYHRTGIGWEKSTHTMGKVWLPISQVLPIRWVLLHLPLLWEIDGKTHAFPTWSDSLIFSCAKCILFGKKHGLNKVSILDIKYGEIHIKQDQKATYLGCLLDKTLSGESMALKVINKINSRLRFI